MTAWLRGEENRKRSESIIKVDTLLTWLTRARKALRSTVGAVYDRAFYV